MKHIFISIIGAFIVGGVFMPHYLWANPAQTSCADKATGQTCSFQSSGRTISGSCKKYTNSSGDITKICQEGADSWKSCNSSIYGTPVNSFCQVGSNLGVCLQSGPQVSCDTSRGAGCNNAERACPSGYTCNSSLVCVTSAGATNPNTGGATNPNTGGATNPNTGGATNPNTGGGATNPNTGGTTDPCGGCPSGKSCVTVNGTPACTDSSNECGTCPSGKVCVKVNGTPACTDAASGGAGGTKTSPQTISFQNPISANSIPELIALIVNALLGLLGAVTVGILIVSGVKYMTSSSPYEVAAATQGITNAVIGLVIIVGAYLITDYVISALVG